VARLHPGAIWGLVKEARIAAEDPRPLLVTGALAEHLAQELGRGARPGAVRTDGRVEDAAVLVRVLAGEPTDEDLAAVRAADRAGVPVIAVQTSGDESTELPYVLATDVVVCPPGAGFPQEKILERAAERLGDYGTSLAARVPALRDPVCDELIEIFSRRNGIIGAAVFVSGADFPVLTLNQLRLVLRIAAAHGVEIDQTRLPEVAATVAAGFGFRAATRKLIGAVSAPRFVVKGTVAYAGTRAVGEAARLYFAARVGNPLTRIPDAQDP
jgi:uncharacterized protein (DUF697 family)